MEIHLVLQVWMFMIFERSSLIEDLKDLESKFQLADVQGEFWIEEKKIIENVENLNHSVFKYWF